MLSTRPLLFLVLAPLLLFSACETGTEEVAMSDEELMETARGIHERVLTIDTHDDIPSNYATEEVNPCTGTDMQVDMPKMRAGGLDVAFFIVYVNQTERTPENYEEAKEAGMTKFNAIHRLTEELCPDQIELAYTADDVERIHASGKLVAAIGIENGYVIGKDLSLLETYHDLGARYITLAHGGHNDISDSSQPDEGDEEEEHDGLSEFGEEVVAEMNRLGIMVDVSHISKKASLHAMRVSQAPVIASHSSTRALADHPRNMDDEQLMALQANGGVMQTVAFNGYVKVASEARNAAMDSLRGVYLGEGGFRGLTAEQRAAYDLGLGEIDELYPPATVSDFVDHIDYAVNLIGVDHVGISSDFDGGGGVTGWDDASETFNVTLELVRRGYTEEEIAKIWGGNLLRVWREVENVAAGM